MFTHGVSDAIRSSVCIWNPKSAILLPSFKHIHVNKGNVFIYYASDAILLSWCLPDSRTCLAWRGFTKTKRRRSILFKRTRLTFVFVVTTYRLFIGWRHTKELERKTKCIIVVSLYLKTMVHQTSPCSTQKTDCESAPMTDEETWASEPTRQGLLAKCKGSHMGCL